MLNLQNLSDSLLSNDYVTDVKRDCLSKAAQDVFAFCIRAVKINLHVTCPCYQMAGTGIRNHDFTSAQSRLGDPPAIRLQLGEVL